MGAVDVGVWIVGLFLVGAQGFPCIHVMFSAVVSLRRCDESQVVPPAILMRGMGYGARSAASETLIRQMLAVLIWAGRRCRLLSLGLGWHAWCGSEGSGWAEE